jgi:hypothetical protein
VRFASVVHSPISDLWANSRPKTADARSVMKPSTPNDTDRSAHPFGRGCFPHADPLRQSSRCTLPFPAEAAASLSEQRKRRYDDLPESVEETQLRLWQLASIMGMFSTNDETPSAA